MKLLTDRERKVWISTNVPLMLQNDFDNGLNAMRDTKDRHNIKVLKRLLKRIKNDNLESNEYYAKLQREHENRKTI